MGKEFASAAARWCHLTADLPKPVITGICNKQNEKDRDWFINNFDSLKIVTDNYKQLLESKDIDAIYCAVPHNLHEELYIEILKAKKHLLAEKPFGIDIHANNKICEEIKKHPELIVRCSSEFPYYPGSKRVVDWLKDKKYGQIIEVKCGFHHASDMDLNKPINWKRMVEFNGEYGCMGDLGLHIQHIPFRMGWRLNNIFADLQNIAEMRPDGKGNTVPCNTYDNAVLICNATDPDNGKNFSITFETKRMAPGQTNTWFIEVYGTKGSVKFSTHDPKAFYILETTGKEQGWTRFDIGPNSYIPTITGGIFEFGFSDAFQQMIGAFMSEFEPSLKHDFLCASVYETIQSHVLMSAALESYKTGVRIPI